MAARMRDIADALGVAVITVSKALRNHADISRETRERVFRKAAELNYRPNLAARGLVTGRMYTVGLVVPDLMHPFFAEVAKGISRVLRCQGYGLLIASSEENGELEQREIEQMLAHRVDAIILASVETNPPGAIRESGRRVPLVLIDRQFPDHPCHFVGIDDAAAGYLATSHLAEQSCIHIAHIRGPSVSTALGRLEGYERALRERGLQSNPDHVVAGRTTDDAAEISGYEAMRRLLRTTPRPDGVFCYNDPIALGAMKAILEDGLNVPRDIAVIGCGNVTYSDLMRIPLSSVDQDSTALGENAATLALSLTADHAQNQSPNSARTPTKAILLPLRLVVRDSTRRRAAIDMP